ncbi:hypothetical protein jaqu_23420 [Jannaschia aquimarina]|uniref:DUF998 domain-containing protein n=1 Tax=Jannaschia aquimarina TaxID=935700 RepID=A0A0D1EJT6_9RHOB|nr:hypothetical protein jaqu_23420 [Jannaschia aquimarina]SNT01608.1 Protein of unknown function [Jannaschia aquimarina]
MSDNSGIVSPDDPGAERPTFLRLLAMLAVGGCVVFAVSVLIADFVVPNHDWVADTISDLGAGRYEFIVDIGIYAYSCALIACAVGASHSHMGGRGWSFGIFGLIFMGLIVFLVGARNEYGDGDNEGVVIHSQLVWALGLLFAAVPWAMSYGAEACSVTLKWIFRGVAILWVPLAPAFMLVVPDTWDGIYERGLGLLTFIFVCAMAWLLVGRAAAVEAARDG